MNKIKKGLLEEYEDIKEDALEIASIKSEDIIALYSNEMNKLMPDFFEDIVFMNTPS